MSHGLYAGTFDPPTNGHAHVIRTSASLFGRLTVAVAVNSEKKTMFSEDERLALLRQTCASMPNVDIVSLKHEYTVDAAARLGAGFLVRGVRNAADLDYERILAHVNGKIRRDVESIIVMPPPDVEDISSSLVKGLVGPPGWRKAVSAMVPRPVYDALVVKHFPTLLKREVPKYCEGHHRDIISAYTQKHRGYHTLDHVTNCLELLRANSDLAADYDLIARVITYHDFFYDPKAEAGQNERWSANEFKRQNDSYFDYNRREKGVEMILASARHFDPTYDTDDVDTALFLDIDVASFASSEDEQALIAAGIRKEYDFVPEDVYCATRAKLLRTLLNKQFIYRTERFCELYEAKARENIKREIARLDFGRAV